MIRALVLATILLLPSTMAWSGSDERKGTSGAGELLIPVGPRTSALGIAGASDVVGAEATFWNPAGLAPMEGTEALFSHTQYFADMQVNYAAAATQLGALGTLGFSAKVLSVGDVIVTTEQAPEGTGEILNPTFTVLGISWARTFSDRVSFGSTVNFVSEQVSSLSAHGVAFDFGARFDPGWRGMQLSMTIKNIGSSMHYGGQNLDVSVLPPGSEPSASNRIVRFTTSSFEMPSFFNLSGSADAYRQGPSSVRVYGAFQNNNFTGDSFSGGAEYWYRKQFALRGSWFGTMTGEPNPTGGDETVSFQSGDDLYTGLALGGTANLMTGATSLGIDAAWRPVRDFFDDVVEVGVRLKF
jgi:hypothetical protein